MAIGYTLFLLGVVCASVALLIMALNNKSEDVDDNDDTDPTQVKVYSMVFSMIAKRGSYTSVVAQAISVQRWVPGAMILVLCDEIQDIPVKMRVKIEDIPNARIEQLPSLAEVDIIKKLRDTVPETLPILHLPFHVIVHKNFDYKKWKQNAEDRVHAVLDVGIHEQVFIGVLWTSDMKLLSTQTFTGVWNRILVTNFCVNMSDELCSTWGMPWQTVVSYLEHNQNLYSFIHSNPHTLSRIVERVR
jgi:hypothetical protein